MDIKTILPVILTSGTRNPEKLLDDVSETFGRAFAYRDSFRDGASISTKTAIRHGYERDCTAFQLFLEDDVEIHPSLGDRLSLLEYPEKVGVLSLCDMREMRHNAPDGIYVKSALGCDNRGWWGNQAMLIHPDIVEMLVRQDWNDRIITSFPSVMAHAVNFGDLGKNCSDIRMSLLVDIYGGNRNKYAVYVPSLVLHLGFVSNCFPDRYGELGERETKNWIGDRNGS